MSRPTQPAPDVVTAKLVGLAAFYGQFLWLKLVSSNQLYLFPPTCGYPVKSIRGRPHTVGRFADFGAFVDVKVGKDRKSQQLNQTSEAFKTSEVLKLKDLPARNRQTR